MYILLFLFYVNHLKRGFLPNIGAMTINWFLSSILTSPDRFVPVLWCVQSESSVPSANRQGPPPVRYSQAHIRHHWIGYLKISEMEN